MKLKVGGASRRHLGFASLPDNRKWAKRRDMLFQIDMKHYIELLLGLKNSKAKRTRSICESFALFV